MIYKRSITRFYTCMDFEDGERIKFVCYPEQPSAKAAGFIFCSSYTRPYMQRLVDRDEFEYEEGEYIIE